MNYYGSHLICQSLKLSVSLWSKCQNEYEQNFYDLVCLSSVAISDGQYVAPLMKTANYHAETANTYMYAFSYSTQSESPSSAQDKEDTSVKKIYLYFLRMVVVCYNCNTDICMQCGFSNFKIGLFHYAFPSTHVHQTRIITIDLRIVLRFLLELSISLQFNYVTLLFCGLDIFIFMVKTSFVWILIIWIIIILWLMFISSSNLSLCANPAEDCCVYVETFYCL